MQDLDLKKKVLSEIMGLMDEKEGDRLKNHPKLLAAKIEVAKPADSKSEMGIEKLLGDKNEMDQDHEVSESPSVESEEEMSPELIQKLIEMMNGK